MKCSCRSFNQVAVRLQLQQRLSVNHFFFLKKSTAVFIISIKSLATSSLWLGCHMECNLPAAKHLAALRQRRLTPVAIPVTPQTNLIRWSLTTLVRTNA